MICQAQKDDKKFMFIFLETILEDTGPFCVASDTPVLDFWWRPPWVSKPGWIPGFRASSNACNGFLRFISGVTPADLLTVYSQDWHNRKQWVLVPFPASDQCEHFCTILGPFVLVLFPVPVPVPFPCSVNKPQYLDTNYVKWSRCFRVDFIINILRLLRLLCYIDKHYLFIYSFIVD